MKKCKKTRKMHFFAGIAEKNLLEESRRDELSTKSGLIKYKKLIEQSIKRNKR
ncbi:MAG: hypothetical protein QXS38_01320 [Candidatus Pacearchaeota archaeon]